MRPQTLSFPGWTAAPRLRLHAVPKPSSSFYSKTIHSFDKLSLDPTLQLSLTQNGFIRPSEIQALTIGDILEGKDVVIAAETGSGKTMAYLLPLLTKVLQQKDSDPADREPKSAMVLCPSVDLCRQVLKVTTALCPEISVEISPIGLQRQSNRPDVLIGTPGSVVGVLQEMSRDSSEKILNGFSVVVVDEADLMLTGSYRSQIDRIFQARCRLDRISIEEMSQLIYSRERDQAISSLTTALGMTREEFLSLPKHIRRAGIEDGVAGMVEAGFEVPEGARDCIPSWRRQFILAGATMPSLGTKNVRDEIAKLFPRAEIKSTANLHKTSAQLDYSWIEIDPDERREVVLGVVRESIDASEKTLVFSKDTATAASLARFLSESGVECVGYHKKLGVFERRENLRKFAEGECFVMVSTDGMSRGIDIVDIAHVVQSEFASSAVAFVHRVGRTARAWRSGRVTCLWTDEDRQLAEAIRDRIDRDEPIDGAFSRRRSFRKKYRRYGTVVPRGSVPDSSLFECSETFCPILD